MDGAKTMSNHGAGIFFLFPFVMFIPEKAEIMYATLSLSLRWNRSITVICIVKVVKDYLALIIKSI